MMLYSKLFILAVLVICTSLFGCETYRTVEIHAYDAQSHSSIEPVQAKVYRRTVNSLGQGGYEVDYVVESSDDGALLIENLPGNGAVYITAQGYHGSRITLGDFKRMSAYSDARKYFDIEFDDAGTLNVPMLPTKDTP